MRNRTLMPWTTGPAAAVLKFDAAQADGGRNRHSTMSQQANLVRNGFTAFDLQDRATILV
jgi:hypothetical protein